VWSTRRDRGSRGHGHPYRGSRDLSSVRCCAPHAAHPVFWFRTGAAHRRGSSVHQIDVTVPRLRFRDGGEPARPHRRARRRYHRRAEAGPVFGRDGCCLDTRAAQPSLRLARSGTCRLKCRGDGRGGDSTSAHCISRAAPTRGRFGRACQVARMVRGPCRVPRRSEHHVRTVAWEHRMSGMGSQRMEARGAGLVGFGMDPEAGRWKTVGCQSRPFQRKGRVRS
jgi:hypothetical protein